MDSLLFDPKENIVENNEKDREGPSVFLYMMILAGIAMLSILYQKSTITITDLYDKTPNPIYLVIDRIKTALLSFNKPIINKNSIQMIRYSYELPKSLDFLYR
jgi:hypothetical protein